MMAQFYPGSACRGNGFDSADARIHWFCSCLKKVSELDPKPESIACAKLIGCGLAGGHFPHYETVLKTFSEEFNIRVVMYDY
jgi:hypothetical protein